MCENPTVLPQERRGQTMRTLFRLKVTSWRRQGWGHCRVHRDKGKAKVSPTAARAKPSQAAASLTDVESHLISHTVTKADNITPKDKWKCLEPFVGQICEWCMSFSTPSNRIWREIAQKLFFFTAIHGLRRRTWRNRLPVKSPPNLNNAQRVTA